MDRRRGRPVLSVAEATAINSQHFPEIQRQFQAWSERFRASVEAAGAHPENVDFDKLVSATSKAAEIGAAMFSTRYGVGDKVGYQGPEDYHCLYYHNTQHALDIIARLDMIFDHFGFEHFPATRRVLLTLFAAFHDLRQLETEGPTNGIGANESTTAEEAVEIVRLSFEEAGFKSDADADIFEYLTGNMGLMIHGTTFNFGSREEQITNPFTKIVGPGTIPTGALAPLIASQVKDAFPKWRETPALTETIENILLAADVDTANVSDDFTDFAKQGVNLCREIEKRKGCGPLDPVAVFGFMTSGQEYYFNVAQHFNTRYAKAVFEQLKANNKPKLDTLTQHMRTRFGDPAVNCRELLKNEAGAPSFTGDEVMEEYMRVATALAEDRSF